MMGGRPRVLARRPSSRSTLVERDQDPPLTPGRDQNQTIATAAQILLDDRLDVVAAFTQIGGELCRQVLVELEAHAGSADHLLLVHELGGICQRRAYVVGAERGIGAQDLLQ